MFINFFENNLNNLSRYYFRNYNDFNINYTFKSFNKRKLNFIIDLYFEIRNFENFKNLNCYGYGDFLVSILSSILLRSICLIKIQALFNNCAYLKSILLNE